MSTPEAVLEQHRPMLFGLAYRMLGSSWDADDVLQDAYLRWRDADVH
ncbi:MAG: sigma factor, partial [Jiangellaceae bacterium]